MTLWKNLVVALVAAFALAACSSSDNGSTTMDDPPPTQEELDTANEALEQAEADKAQAEADRDDLQEQLDEAAMKADQAKLMALETDLMENMVDNAARERAPSSTDIPSGADAQDAPATLAGWSGMSWMDDGTTAVVYSNKGSSSSRAFADVYSITNGVVTLTSGPAHGKLIRIENQPAHQSHSALVIDTNDGLPGTFAGVSGQFIAEGSNASITLGMDGLEWTGGTLTFKPGNASAPVNVGDMAYMNLGWWLTEDDDGALDVALASWGAGPSATYDGSSAYGSLEGKATFNGVAVGKYTARAVDGLNGGHFTADAELVANFDEVLAETAGNSIKGTIDNFRQDGDSIGSNWKVELEADVSGVNDAGVADLGDTATVAGTFGSVKTTEGTWSATYYDSTRNDPMPGAVGGLFNVEHAVINMHGAYAAENQVPQRK